MDMKPCLFGEQAGHIQIKWTLFYIKLLFTFLVPRPGLSDEQTMWWNICLKYYKNFRTGIIGQIHVCSPATLQKEIESSCNKIAVKTLHMALYEAMSLISQFKLNSKCPNRLCTDEYTTWNEYHVFSIKTTYSSCNIDLTMAWFWLTVRKSIIIYVHTVRIWS